jgi:hypothetical protein
MPARTAATYTSLLAAHGPTLASSRWWPTKLFFGGRLGGYSQIPFTAEANARRPQLDYPRQQLERILVMNRVGFTVAAAVGRQLAPGCYFFDIEPRDAQGV